MNTPTKAELESDLALAKEMLEELSPQKEKVWYTSKEVWALVSAISAGLYTAYELFPQNQTITLAIVGLSTFLSTVALYFRLFHTKSKLTLK